MKTFQTVTLGKDLVEIRLPDGTVAGIVLKSILVDAGQFKVKMQRGGWYVLGHEYQPFKTFDKAVAALLRYAAPKLAFDTAEEGLAHNDGSVHLFLKRRKKFFNEEMRRVKKMAFRKRKKLLKARAKSVRLGGGIVQPAVL